MGKMTPSCRAALAGPAATLGAALARHFTAFASGELWDTFRNVVALRRRTRKSTSGGRAPMARKNTSVIHDPHNVPVQVVDQIAAFGLVGGNVHLSLATNRTSTDEGGSPIDDIIIAARLRLAPHIAKQLRDAIDQQLALASKPRGTPN
ncbi:MAG: hypothetical protein JO273_14205 [Methylobacteriaceae bacterium]|nr:hypothetical protein [Methylobacteriaceae bacterium]